MALILDTGIVYVYTIAATPGMRAPNKSSLTPQEPACWCRHRSSPRSIISSGIVSALRPAGCSTPAFSRLPTWFADVPREQYARIVELNRQYPDIGFVDAAVVAIAESRRLRRIATTDRRHSVRWPGTMARARSQTPRRQIRELPLHLCASTEAPRSAATGQPGARREYNRGPMARFPAAVLGINRRLARHRAARGR